MADFIATPRSGLPPLNVGFSDLSTGIVTSWLWAFGDGATSIMQYPTHTYTMPGTYTVSLTATGPGGADSETKVGYIVVSEAVDANFTAEPPMGDAPLAVRFRNTSTGSIDTVSLSFGDGRSASGPFTSVVHTYDNEGIYRVCLTAMGPGGTDTKCLDIFVEAISTAPRLEVSNVVVSPVYAQPGQQIAIYADVSNTGGAWGSESVDLVINGQFEQSQPVGLAPGTTQTIRFTVYKVQSGTYQVDVGGATGVLYVLAQPTPTPASSTGGGLLPPGGGLDTATTIAIIVIGVIVLGGAILAILLTRRS